MLTNIDSMNQDRSNTDGSVSPNATIAPGGNARRETGKRFHYRIVIKRRVGVQNAKLTY